MLSWNDHEFRPYHRLVTHVPSCTMVLDHACVRHWWLCPDEHAITPRGSSVTVQGAPMSKLSTRHRTRSSQGEARPFEGMCQVTSHAAGVDISAHEIMACVPDGHDHQIVRAFGTYTADLQTLADWFVDRGIKTIAMESTGVYWMP